MTVLCLSTYNGSKYLLEFLASLEAQTYQKYHLIIRDDGSSDNTLSILQAFQHKYPNRVEILHDGMNGGAKASFGKLIEAALQNPKWEYLMFADQDDVWMCDKIALTRTKMESMANEFGNDVPLLVHTDLSVVDSSLNILSESFWSYQHVDPMRDKLHNQIIQNVITGCTVMINRPLAILSLPIQNEAIMHDWWISLVASTFGHIGIVPQPTILYRQHDSNDTGAKNYGWKYIYNRFLTRPRLDKYFIQAEAFYTRFGDQMSEQHQDMLNALSRWNEAGFWKRRWLIIRYGLWKKGLVRNIGLIVFA